MKPEYNEVPLATWERVFRILGGGLCLLLALFFIAIPVIVLLQDGFDAYQFLGFGVAGAAATFFLWRYINTGIQGYRLEKIEEVPEPIDPDSHESLLSKWGILILCLVFVAGMAYEVTTGSEFDKGWKFWLVCLAMLTLGVVVIVRLLSITNGWTVGEEEKANDKIFTFLGCLPFALAGIAVAAFAVFSFLGWFASIPSWAAVIIVLMVLILFAVERRK
jgi:hypothetical protein